MFSGARASFRSPRAGAALRVCIAAVEFLYLRSVRRRNLREIAFKSGCPLALVSFLMFCVGCQPAHESAPSPSEPVPTQQGASLRLPEADYEMLHLTLEQQDEQGRTLWKLQAQALHAETRDSQAQGTLTQVRGWLYRNGKPVLEFTAPYARANAETREVEAWGGVVATSKTSDARLSAGRILWQARRDRARASGGVRLRWGEFELRERALTVDTALEKAWSDD
jgi:LPS export ABC transporter protein LptC